MKVLGRYIFERRPKFLTEDLVISSELQSVVDSLNDLDSAKQDLLVSGLNIKTVNGQSILGSGDISIVSSLFKFSAVNYSALLLVTGAVAGDLAYVYNSQGTLILPGNWGGTYYDKGAYVFDGVNWIDDNDLTNKTLQESIDSLNLLAVDVALLYTNKLNKPTVTTVSGSSYTVLATDSIINITSTTCTITFPDALLLDDFKEFTLFFTDCNLTIQRTGTNYIDNQTSWTLQNSGSFNVQKIDSNNYRIS